MRERAIFRARVILAAYVLFSAAVSVFDFWSRSQKELREQIVPLTGWTGLSTYWWTFFFAIFAIFHTDRSGMMSVLGMLGFCTIGEAVMTFWKAFDAWNGDPDFGNPYLTYHPLRPLVTVAPPAVWFVVLWCAGRGLPPAPSVQHGSGKAEVAKASIGNSESPGPAGES